MSFLDVRKRQRKLEKKPKKTIFKLISKRTSIQFVMIISLLLIGRSYLRDHEPLLRQFYYNSDLW